MDSTSKIVNFGISYFKNFTNLSNTAKGHNWFYRNWFLGAKKYQKSVVASGTTEGSRVLYFSNPDVKAHDKARDNTGTSTRNNFVQLRNAASVVGCYDDFDDMVVDISGPSSAQIGETVTLSASVSNCPSRTYRWEVSYDGFSYGFLGTGSSVSYRIFPVDNYNSVNFRLTVTCSDGQTRTAFKFVYVENIDCGDPFVPCLQSVLNQDELAESNIQQSPVSLLIYPNPTSQEVNLAFSAPIGGRITVDAYSMLSGKNHRLYQGRTKEVNNELILNVSNLNQGLYQLNVTLDGTEFGSQKLIIQR